jgi:hypothetical protein
MSHGGGQNSYDNSFVMMVFVLALFAGGYFLIQYFSAPILQYFWKYLRAIELGLTFRFGEAIQVINHPWLKYDHVFSYVNNEVWKYFQWLSVPLLVVAVAKLFQNSGNWTMENYLDVIYKRFPWLAFIFSAPDKPNLLTKKAPFIVIGPQIEYKNLVFPDGEEPLDFLEKNSHDLTNVLVKQLGPRLETKNKKLVWKDKWAKQVAEQCYKMIPNKKPTPDALSWQAEAWNNCFNTHRFERTFALGMLESARKFGVISPAEFFYLRAGAALKDGKFDRDAFLMWRAVCCFGGRTAFPESSGIMSHYLYEKSLNNHLKKHPEDKAIAFHMRNEPYVTTAIESFAEMKKIIMEQNKRK